MALLALGEWFEPRPPVAAEADVRLLAARSAEVPRALAAACKNKPSINVVICMFFFTRVFGAEFSSNKKTKIP